MSNFCIIETSKQDVPDVLVRKVLTKIDNCCVPVHVLNRAGKPRKIKTGTYLARGESVWEDDISSQDLQFSQLIAIQRYSMLETLSGYIQCLEKKVIQQS